MDGDTPDVVVAGIAYDGSAVYRKGAALAPQRGMPRRHITWMYVTWSLATLAIAGYGLAVASWQLALRLNSSRIARAGAATA